MGLKLITAPTAEPLTLAQAYVQCQIDTTTTGSPAVTTSDSDDWLTATIPVVRQQAENELGRALITQTWELWLHDFPRPLLDDVAHDGSRYTGFYRRYRRDYNWRAITIPLPPLQSITSITYIDAEGIQKILTVADDYVLDDSITPAQITPASGTCWPAVTCGPGAVKIRFVCGYPATTTGSPPVTADIAGNVPPAIKHWMLLVLANWFRNREATWQVVSSQTLASAPYVDDLLFPFRVLGHVQS